MPFVLSRFLLGGFALAATVLATGCAGPFGAASAEDRAGRLAPLPDGRNLNFRCSGRGAPTVLLESGFGAGAGAWVKVQPLIARTTRVCAYDRAGYGHSDPGPLPRDGAAIARDLDAALDAAEIHGPFILVGHSAGGLYARLFAARRVQEVQGIVFADATTEARLPPERDGLAGIRTRLQACLDLSERPEGERATNPTWETCRRGDARAAQIAGNPETWRNRLSELDSIFNSTSAQTARTRAVLAEIPAFVVTASETAAAAPKVGYDKPLSVWELQQMRLASHFRFGWQRTVFSSHRVPSDRPEVIAEATLELVRAARAGQRPEGLPPSETDQQDGFGLPGFQTPQ
jgi:pimeloyl-ACP methyl ester carboxylesterase